jgi:uncharacterized protein YgbK (DUF1537 family)
MTSNIGSHYILERTGAAWEETEQQVLAALRQCRLHPIAEILPGVPICRTGTGLYLITKAGGFGPVDVLTQIRSRLGAA